MDAINLEAPNGISSERGIDNEEILSVKRGAWSSHEDSLLINYIAIHGEGRWNFVALDSGMCRAVDELNPVKCAIALEFVWIID